MAAKYASRIYPDSLTHEQLARALEEVRGEVDSLKEQVRVKFEKVFKKLSINRDNLLKELDQLTENISKQINERRNKLNILSAKRIRLQQQMHTDILNSDLKQELAQYENEVCQVLSQEIQFPHTTLHWSELAEQDICRLEKIENRYRFLSDPVWSAVSRGRGAEEMFYPVSLCSDSVSNCIFVADSSLVASRVQVFSTEGDYVTEINHKDMDYINAMVATEKSLFIATEFKLIEMTKHGEKRNSIYLDNTIKGMDFSQEKLYACYKKSSQLRLFDTNLKPIEFIQLNPLSFNRQTTAYDLKVTSDSIYVLFGYIRLVENYFPHPLQEFDHTGTLIKSIVSGNSIVKAFNFVVAENCSIIVSDWGANRIKVFSDAGELLRAIGRDGMTEPGDIYLPRGVALDENKLILVVDGKDKNKLQAF